MSIPLEKMTPMIFSNRGALFEGNAFSILKHSPFIVRSFEHSPADGAIDCREAYDKASSYADRFHDLETRVAEGETPIDLALIDIKGSMKLEEQHLALLGQRRRVAAFICIGAGNPAWVDFIPNMFQDPKAAKNPSLDFTEEEKRYVAVTYSRPSRLPVTAHGMVNLSTSPFRMPIGLLPDAIALARAHIRGESVYVNPWTGVSFDQWSPVAVNTNEALKPSSTAHRTAHLAIMELYRHFAFAKKPWASIDFVGLQPRIGDAKIVLHHSKLLDNLPHRPQTDSTCHPKQRFLEHKYDPLERDCGSKLHNVRVARGEGLKRKWYFDANSRADFYLIQLRFSRRPNPSPHFEFFFLPEEVIPDEFYSTSEKEMSFELEAFYNSKMGNAAGRRGYRIEMDEAGKWVEHVRCIIEAHPTPRSARQRPVRAGAVKEEITIEHASTKLPLEPVAPGRREHAAAMQDFHRRFFYKIMARCAHRGSGLLVGLPRNHPLGDFGYTPFIWSEEEQTQFIRYKRPPRYLHTLPAIVEVVPILCYTRYVETSHHGPNVSAAEFRRLNASPAARLLAWDIGGPDTAPNSLIPLVIPTEDIRLSASQRDAFKGNLGLDSTQWKSTTPSLSSMLSTGLQAGEYSINGSGHLAFLSDPWARICDLLDLFTQPKDAEHPMGHFRNTSLYRHSIQYVNQTLWLDNLKQPPPEEVAQWD